MTTAWTLIQRPYPLACMLRRRLSLLVLPMWLSACVTINVYFPAAEAARAADVFIQDVYGQEPAEKQPEPQQGKEPEPRSQAEPTPAVTAYVLGAIVEFVIPPAHAQANIELSSPAIQRIKGSMTARQGKLNPHYNSGAVGMTADGLITVRAAGAIPLKDRNTVTKLVADDNRDRNALYREVAKANGHPEWEADIRATFAQRWIANAPRGWWYQDKSGAWKQK